MVIGMPVKEMESETEELSRIIRLGHGYGRYRCVFDGCFFQGCREDREGLIGIR